MSVTADYLLQLTVRETITAGVPAASRAVITQDGFNVSGRLDATSTPPATKDSIFQKALAAGVGTIDLRSLTGVNGAAVDGNGLKVQAVLIVNPSTNTGALTITPGASNGYNIFGATSKVVLSPGEQLLWVGYDALPDIDATHKTIDLAGTGTETSDWVIVMG